MIQKILKTLLSILATTGLAWSQQESDSFKVMQVPYARHLAYSPSGDSFALISGGVLKVFSGDGKNLLSYGLGVGDDFLLSPDGRTWALEKTGKPQNALLLRDARTGRDLAEIIDGEFLQGLAFSPDGKLLMTVSRNKYVRFWDARTGRRVGATLRLDGNASCGAISPDGRTVVTGAYKQVRLWDLLTGEPLGPPVPHEALVMAAAFSPDGRFIVTASGRSAQLWEARSGRRLGKPLRHEGRVNVASFSPDSRMILTGASDRTARLWDAETQAPLGEPLRHKDAGADEMGVDNAAVEDAVFRPDQAAALTVTHDGTVRFWNIGRLARPAIRSDQKERAPLLAGEPPDVPP